MSNFAILQVQPDRRLPLIIALGVILRLLALWLFPDPNFPDARAYVTAGADLARNGVMDVEIYMPLYPLWTWIWGGSIGLRIADIGLSGATIWLIYRLTIVLFEDQRAALLAALAAAIYPHFIFYSIVGLTETAYLFTLCSAFLLLYKDRYIVASALLALSILIRPTIDLLAPLLVIAFAVAVHRRGPLDTLKRLVVYCAVYTAVMAPWWIHNYKKYNHFVRLDLGDGIVLFSGNNPQNQSGGGVSDSLKGADMDRWSIGTFKDPVERNNAYRAAAVEFIKENPGRFVELAGLKFVRFWRLWPYTPDFERPAIIAVSLLSFGSVLLLSLVFLVSEGRERFRSIVPILLWATYLTAVHMVTIGSIRYRLPLEPFMVIFASYAAAGLATRVSPLDRLLRRLS